MFRRGKASAAAAPSGAQAAAVTAPVPELKARRTTFIERREDPFAAATMNLAASTFTCAGTSATSVGLTMVGGGGSPIFVADVDPVHSRTSFRIWRGMRLLRCNSLAISPRTTLADVSAAIGERNPAEFVAEYDPWGYRAFDGGEELRIISNFAFQGFSADLAPKAAVGRYLGSAPLAMPLAGSDPKSVAAVVNSTVAAIQAAKHKTDWLDLAISNYCMLAEFGASSGSLGFSHALVDFEKVTARGNLVVIISADLQPSMMRSPICHVYQLKSKDQAGRFSLALSTRCQDGKRRVAQAITRARDGKSKDAARRRSSAPFDSRQLTQRTGQAARPQGPAAGVGAAAAAPAQQVATLQRPRPQQGHRMPGKMDMQPSDPDAAYESAREGVLIRKAHIGQRCAVKGYPASGTVQFVGSHKQLGKPRVGVVLDEAVGKNNGTVQGTWYFACAAERGVLVQPKKVKLKLPRRKTSTASDASARESVFGGFDDANPSPPPPPNPTSPQESFGWEAGGSPGSGDRRRESVAEFTGFGDAASPEFGGFDERGVSPGGRKPDRRASTLFDSSHGDSLPGAPGGGQCVPAGGPGTGAELAEPEFRGKCGRCGQNVYSNQSRSKDKATGTYYHDECPERPRPSSRASKSSIAAAEAEASVKGINLGDRCTVAGIACEGVVAYVGKFGRGTKKWIGVELDEGIGMHDGTIEGRRYFSCKPGHGVMVLPDQISLLHDTFADQLLAKRASRPRRRSAGTINRHNWELLYIGSTVHHTRKGETPTEYELSRAALKDIMADSANEIVRCELQVDDEIVRVFDKKAGEAVQEHAISEVLFCDMIDDVHLIYMTTPKYGTLRRQGNVKFVHAFTAKGELGKRARDNVRRSMSRAEEEDLEGPKAVMSFNAKRLARKSSTVVLDEGAGSSSDTAVIDAVRARHLGTLAVPAGAEPGSVIGDCINVLLKRPKINPMNVAFIITDEGIRIVDEASQEQILTILMQQVRTHCVLDTPAVIKQFKGKLPAWNQKLFIMVHTQASGRIACEIFSAGARADRLYNGLVKATESSLKRQERGPFDPVSRNVARVEGPLAGVQIVRQSLISIEPLGQGQFGEVYLAEQTVDAGKGDDGGNKCKRACKLLRPGASTEDRLQFLAELELQYQFDHPNLVRIVGVCIEVRPWIAVLEYLPYGDIRKVLLYAKDKQVQLSQLEMLMMLQHVAAGMEYIASKRFVHMDLAARNCLLGRSSFLKVADFGATTKIPDGKDFYKLKRKIMLSMKWAAIESIAQKRFNEASDVWSFGITAWEILSYGAHPYKGVKSANILAKVRDEGYRLDKPEEADEETYDLLMCCWDEDPSSRPDFASISAELDELVEIARLNCPPPRDVGLAAQGGVEIDTILDEEFV